MNDALEIALTALCVCGIIALVILGIGICVCFGDYLCDITNNVQESGYYEKIDIAPYEKAIITDKLTNETYIVIGQGDRKVPLVVRLPDIATEAAI